MFIGRLYSSGASGILNDLCAQLRRSCTKPLKTIDAYVILYVNYVSDVCIRWLILYVVIFRPVRMNA